MRLMPLLICLLLTACADPGHALTPEQANANAQGSVQGSAEAIAQRTAQAEPAAPQAKKPARKPAKSEKTDGKGNQGLGESWLNEQEGAITHDRVSAGCWMKYERGRRDLPLEQRADLVNKCVDDTYRAFPDLVH